MSYDLLSTVEYGGCSAKLSPDQLARALANLPRPRDPNLLVDINTHDDAGVYRVSEDLALIQTTDFFPPICSDPYEFGQIAAANALSDVFAMGGQALTALNLVMFSSSRIPLEVLGEILRGGMDKVTEAGAVIVGGHTIDDHPPKYGLAVTGTVHPRQVVTNTGARPGDILVLTKPLGTGVIVAGRRIGEVAEENYRGALESMKQLNRGGAEVMRESGIRCATDITGFGLLGHGLEMAGGGNVTLRIDASAVPRLGGAYELLDLGCIPGAAFRNLAHVESRCRFESELDYNLKMLLLDAQTSGGLLMAVAAKEPDDVLEKLHERGYHAAAVIGRVLPRSSTALVVGP